MLILGILVAFVLGLAVAPLYPGGIRMGRWRVWGYADEVAYTDPGPLLELDKQQLRRRPLVWDPNGPEIQVGPDLPWREGGEYRLIVGRWQYWLRIEAPSGRYEIAPPLP